jgi:transglutaminase-like putative cysteine protease
MNYPGTVEENRVRHSATRRTMLALTASALAAMPLKALLSDSRWLFEAWLTMALVIAPAALLRLRRSPSALDIWPGIILLVPWLTRLFVAKHAWGGFIPSGRSFHDLSRLMDTLHHTTSDEVAPIHSTVAVRLVICALLGLLAALVDLIAVVGRRGALAGVPLLVVFTVAGAVPRSPVAWFWFAVAAAGFLILLALDAEDELREWGRRIPRRGGVTSRPMLAFSAQRIGVFAILVAVVLPFAVPGHPHNLLREAFSSDNGNGLGGFGAGSTGGSISPFAALKGQLNRTKSVPLMKVHIDHSTGQVQPFYARSNILDKFTGKGWVVSQHGNTEPIGATTFGTQPNTGTPPVGTYRATITISGLTGNAPVFAVPQGVQGLDAGTTWSEQDQLLLGSVVHSGDTFSEQVAQPQPTAADLSATTQDPAAQSDLQRWLQLPSIPTSVVNRVNQLTRSAQGPYARASAIFRFFADPANGFFYSLKTPNGDSGNDLVDFLHNRTGYCQQFAAAMAVMLRLAGVPSRVVLGYMHRPPDGGGNFTVTTFDAHAWVEAYFEGLGWIPFDPTPTEGLAGGKKTDLSYAQHSYGSDAGAAGPTLSNHARTGERSVNPGPTSGATVGSGSGSGANASLIWALAVLLVVGAVVATPSVVRAGRRRRRYTAARGGDPDPLWAELSDTAVDLGYVWSPARTPRQVSAWLAGDAADSAPALQNLAVAVEQQRYSPHVGRYDAGELARGLQEVTDQLRARRRGRVRFTARLFPASLGWGRRLSAVRNTLRRTH